MLLGWKVDTVAKGIGLWIGFTVCMMSILIRDTHSTFFKIGPNENLHIFGIRIDTGLRYTVVVGYTVCSTVVRTLQQEVLLPWIIQSVQNDHEKNEYTKAHAYEVVLVDVTYRWFDWFMYMNILLSQIDMTIIEMVGNLVTSYYMTKYYIRNIKKKEPEISEGEVQNLPLILIANSSDHIDK